MGETKHTPGPWEAKNMFVESPNAEDGVPIAEVFGTTATYEANARLIAAAPCLLEAARHAELVLSGWGDDAGGPEYVAYKALQDAIAKATGGVDA